MTDLAEQALAYWGMADAACILVAARENQVFKVFGNNEAFALRLHRPGYRSDGQIRSELDWMAAAAREGLSTPAPRPSVKGQLMHSVNDVQADVLTWVEGQTLAQALPERTAPERAALFHRLGETLAHFHTISDAWEKPDGFSRPHWDLDGLLGSAPLWDRFWENPTLTANDRALANAFRDAARAALSRVASQRDYGLIHADLVPDNVLVNGAGISFIDFDDGGFGFRLFDLATALFKHRDRSDYKDLQGAFLDGYQARRGIDTSALELFFALRAATYLGWIIRRMDEPGAEERNARFVRAFRPLARGWLES